MTQMPVKNLLSRLKQTSRVWRLALLGMLTAAFLGPWVFDLIMVPAEYSCSAPFYRLEGNYCGTPLPGTWMLWAALSEATNVIMGLASGALSLAEIGRRGLFILGALSMTLPFFSTLRLLLAGDGRRWQIFNLAAWALAAALGLLFGLSNHPEMYRVLWGAWLYIGAALAALELEALSLAAGRASTWTGETARC